MKTSDIIKGNEIYIPESAWKSMNESHSKEEIRQLISDAIQEYDIPLPYRQITEQDAWESFKDLQALDAKTLLKSGKVFTRYDYLFDFNLEYIDFCNVGNAASDFFHQTNRWLCDSINSPSPHRTWTEEKFRLTLLNCLWTLKFNQVTSKELRSAIHLRKYVASQFRPAAAKAIYQHFNSKRVLDFSAGWGDRLCAFHSCPQTEFYFGVDPSDRVHSNYQRQNEFYKTGKEVSLVKGCAEDVEIPENTFDTVFTSPPYFNIERYTGTFSEDSTQSWKRYKKLEVWLEKFLFRTIEKSWKALKSGGVLAVNISDVYSNHQINRICDPMNAFIGTLANDASAFQGAMGLRMAKRPNSKSEQEGVFVEPIWVWRKP
jgi:hypothetical protein